MKETKESQKTTQCQKVIEWLIKPGRSLTREQCYKRFGFMTLNSRVSDINRAKKYQIRTEMVKLKSGARIARYSML